MSMSLSLNLRIGLPLTKISSSMKSSGPLSSLVLLFMVFPQIPFSRSCLLWHEAYVQDFGSQGSLVHSHQGLPL